MMGRVGELHDLERQKLKFLATPLFMCCPHPKSNQIALRHYNMKYIFKNLLFLFTTMKAYFRRWHSSTHNKIFLHIIMVSI